MYGLHFEIQAVMLGASEVQVDMEPRLGQGTALFFQQTAAGIAAARRRLLGGSLSGQYAEVPG